MNLLVRTDIPPSAAVATVRSQISCRRQHQPVNEIQTAEELIDNSRAQPRFTMLLIGGFSGTALVLAIVGVYSVLSYSVGQRRQEFSIRLALGAHPTFCASSCGKVCCWRLVGILAGLGASLMMTRLLENVLYQDRLPRPCHFFLRRLSFLLVAALASYLPARRAMRVEPAETLR